MYQLKVKDMTCGHCANRITQAIKAIDASAVVEIDLEQKRVGITSTHPLAEITTAMTEAGYPPQTIAAGV